MRRSFPSAGSSGFHVAQVPMLGERSCAGISLSFSCWKKFLYAWNTGVILDSACMRLTEGQKSRFAPDRWRPQVWQQPDCRSTIEYIQQLHVWIKTDQNQESWKQSVMSLLDLFFASGRVVETISRFSKSNRGSALYIPRIRNGFIYSRSSMDVRSVFQESLILSCNCSGKEVSLGSRTATDAHSEQQKLQSCTGGPEKRCFTCASLSHFQKERSLRISQKVESRKRCL